MLPEVPVVARPDLPTAPAAVKEAILHGSIWDGKGESDDDDDDDEDGNESPQGDAVEDKGTVSKKMDARAYRTSYPKRGRALLRAPTDSEVILFHHPTHPHPVQELCNRFQATWLVSGTPDAGCAILGAMERGLPVVALARNEAHKNALVKILSDQIRDCVLSPGSAFTS